MRLISKLRCKKGASMAEAAIALPVLILAVMLMIRMFVFYLEILDTSVMGHIEALEAMDGYSGAGLRTYTSTKEVSLLRGGLLKRTASKRIDIRVYMINEDLLVRAGEAL